LVAAWNAIIPASVRAYRKTLKLPARAAIRVPKVTDEKVMVKDHGLVAKNRVFAFIRRRILLLRLLSLDSSQAPSPEWPSVTILAVHQI
jgi:hypothetical protein